MTRRDGVLILLAAVVLLAGALVVWQRLGAAALAVVPVSCTILLVFVIVEAYRRLSHALDESQRRLAMRQEQDYRQVEALLSLFFTLKPSVPLPTTRDWAASPDLLKKIVETVLAEKPGLVMEASSGVSTLVIAYCLRQLGAGKVVSLEHDANYAEISRQQIRFHGLEDVATVLHAPLVPFTHRDQTWLWYDTAGLQIEQPIDLLVVDGPPASVQRLARYPAMPALYRHLNKRATVILDDGGRADEKRIVALWGQEFALLSAEFLALEKGAFVIRKHEGSHTA